MAELLHETHNFAEHKQTLKLSGSYEYETIVEVFARFTQYGAKITRIKADAQPQTFELHENQMDALCEAWQAFKASIVAWPEQEEKRLEQVMIEVREIVDTHPGMVLDEQQHKQGGEPRYCVRIPEHGWSMQWETNPDRLMSQVKDAIEVWKSYNSLEDRFITQPEDDNPPY